MHRKQVRPQRHLAERKEFARQFNNLLVLGKRPSGPDRTWKNTEFADALYDSFPREQPYTEASVRGWSNVEQPGNPDRDVIVPILDTIFGTKPPFRPEREALHNAWRRANGLREPEPPEAIESLTGWVNREGFDTERLAELALTLHRVTDLDPDLWHVDANLVVSIRDDEMRIGERRRAVSIGLRDAFLALTAPAFDVVPHSMLGGIGRPREHLKRQAGGIGIHGPINPACKRLDGEPLDEMPLASIRRKETGPAEVTASLQAGHRSFKVTDPDSNAEIASADKEIVLNQLFANKYGSDNGRITLAKARWEHDAQK